MHTRKYPRTMQEAFGPYESYHLLPMSKPKDPRIVRAVFKLAVGVAALVVASWVTVSVLFSFSG